MNHTEAVILCRAVAAYCPQQRFDEFTPDAWHDLLGDLRLEDAREAAIAIAKAQPFVAPAEIRAKVRVIRDARIAAAPPMTPPPGLDDLGTRRWIGDERRRIGDGDPPHDTSDLPTRDLRRIESTFRRVPGAQ